MALKSLGIGKLLKELAVLAVSLDGTDRLSCGIVLRSGGLPLAIACSDALAARLEEIQQSIGDGPGLTAMRTGRVAAVEDTAGRRRWAKFEARAAAEGVGSALSVPLACGDSQAGVLSLYAPGAGTFGEIQLHRAHSVATVVSGTLALAVGRAEQAIMAADLHATLAARSVIDQAVGIVMAQERCTSGEAFDLLRQNSQNRNVKLREVAAGLVTDISGRPPQPPSFRHRSSG
jgi:GAF domain-containing protein